MRLDDLYVLEDATTVPASGLFVGEGGDLREFAEIAVYENLTAAESAKESYETANEGQKVNPLAVHQLLRN